MVIQLSLGGRLGLFRFDTASSRLAIHAALPSRRAWGLLRTGTVPNVPVRFPSERRWRKPDNGRAYYIPSVDTLLAPIYVLILALARVVMVINPCA